MSKQYSKEEISEQLTDILVNDFEVDPQKITNTTRLFEDLDFDSIDAVDLAVRLQNYTNKKIAPEEFKQIRTIEDVVNAVYELMQ